jgi:hypothetical protein
MRIDLLPSSVCGRGLEYHVIGLLVVKDSISKHARRWLAGMSRFFVSWFDQIRVTTTQPSDGVDRDDFEIPEFFFLAAFFASCSATSVLSVLAS